ncbi:MAG: radical SAM family heme chaperone HemW, partial [Janthinobacterium lividum]
MNALGLYISVPFCTGKCTFCNFASDSFPKERMGSYVDRLCGEIASNSRFAEENSLLLPDLVDSIFLGGGTPTLLQPEHLSRLFSALNAHFHVSSDAEITVEAAPGQIPDGVLATLLKGGVNRMSLGVQSFIDSESRAVGRSHTGASCRAELDRLRSAGIQNLNVDLIAGLPHQTAESWAESLQQAIDSGVDHVSVYMLEVDEDSRLGRELIGPGVRYGAAATPGEAQVADLYTQACETLKNAGICQYEISNFAREDHESRHNRKYWTRAPYVGFGLDAHSMLFDRSGTAARFANGDELEPYIRNSDNREVERIDPLASWEETIFLGLRLSQGLLLPDLYRDYPSTWLEQLLSTVGVLSREGLLRLEDDRVSLTQRGRL